MVAPRTVALVDVNRHLRELLQRHHGVVSRADALATVPRGVLEHAVDAGQLVRLFPRVYVDAARMAEPWVRARAALCYAGPEAALSHVSALAVWRLPGGTLDSPVHVLVPADGRRSGGTGLVLHRRRGFTADPPGVVTRAGLATCRVELCVVDSWAMLPDRLRRATVITAVADRRTTARRLLAAIDRNPSLPDRAEAVRLVNLLARGCRSWLELYSYDHIFAGPDLPRIERDVRIRLATGRSIYLDVYCPAAKVNFELDGAAHHTSPGDRERDARRDAILATMGIMVVRFTHHQLVHTPDLVREQIRQIVAARLAAPRS